VPLVHIVAGSPHSLVLQLQLPAARHQMYMLHLCLQEDLQLQPAVHLFQCSADMAPSHRRKQIVWLHDRQKMAVNASVAANNSSVQV
jgi:hypothetical protein